MNRRRFLSLLGLGVAGVALEQAIPLGRVWSFPKEIVVGKIVNFRFPPAYFGIDFAWDSYEQAIKAERSDNGFDFLTPAPRRIFRPSPS